MKRLPASATLAMASLVSLGAQAMMGVAMLHFFSPEATGRFAVIAQVAFFWVTLALAGAILGMKLRYGARRRA